uniref:Claudin 2 n=1 Tax=Amazona collaria TaxID=241587 RepID=A0A8B9FY79_9PSIT
MVSMGLQLLGYTVAFLGYIGTLTATLLPSWKTSSYIGASIVTAVSFTKGLWMECATYSTGITQCDIYSSLLNLPADIQAAQALMHEVRARGGTLPGHHLLPPLPCWWLHPLHLLPCTRHHGHLCKHLPVPAAGRQELPALRQPHTEDQERAQLLQPDGIRVIAAAGGNRAGSSPGSPKHLGWHQANVVRGEDTAASPVPVGFDAGDPESLVTAGPQPAAPLSLPGWGWVDLYPQGPRGPGTTAGPGCLRGSGVTAVGLSAGCKPMLQ